jgi:hypothetical protein
MPTLKNPRRLAFFGAAIILLSLGLLFFARDLIREVIVLPLAYLVWVVGLFINTTAQMVFWLTLLAIAGLAAYRSLAGRREAVALSPPELAELGMLDDPLYHGQVSYWDMRVRWLRTSTSAYFRDTFHHSLGRLLLDTLAHRYRLSPAQVENGLRDGSLSVPPAVRDYAIASLRRMDSGQGGLLMRMGVGITGWLRGWFYRMQGADGSSVRDPRLMEDEKRVAVIISFLEEELEVSNDDDGR